SGKAATPQLEGLLALKGVIEAEDAGLEPDAQAELEAAIGASIAVALDGLLASRRDEGRSLLAVLTAQGDRIGVLAGAAARRARRPAGRHQGPLRGAAEGAGGRGGQRGAHRPGGGRHGGEGRRAGGAGQTVGTRRI